MTKRKLHAGFKKAIKKWEYLSSGKAEDEPECAMCVLFIWQGRGGKDYNQCPLQVGCHPAEVSLCCKGFYASWAREEAQFGLNSRKTITAAKKVLSFIKRKAREAGMEV